MYPSSNNDITRLCHVVLRSAGVIILIYNFDEQIEQTLALIHHFLFKFSTIFLLFAMGNTSSKKSSKQILLQKLKTASKTGVLNVSESVINLRNKPIKIRLIPMNFCVICRESK